MNVCTKTYSAFKRAEHTSPLHVAMTNIVNKSYIESLKTRGRAVGCMSWVLEEMYRVIKRPCYISMIRYFRCCVCYVYRYHLIIGAVSILHKILFQTDSLSDVKIMFEIAPTYNKQWKISKGFFYSVSLLIVPPTPLIVCVRKRGLQIYLMTSTFHDNHVGPSHYRKLNTLIFELH